MFVGCGCGQGSLGHTREGDSGGCVGAVRKLTLRTRREGPKLMPGPEAPQWGEGSTDTERREGLQGNHELDLRRGPAALQPPVLAQNEYFFLHASRFIPQEQTILAYWSSCITSTAVASLLLDPSRPQRFHIPAALTAGRGRPPRCGDGEFLRAPVVLLHSFLNGVRCI